MFSDFLPLIISRKGFKQKKIVLAVFLLGTRQQLKVRLEEPPLINHSVGGLMRRLQRRGENPTGS